ncbi:MAG: phosphoribosylformylglycinamidine cyclo-ligase [Spirochaetales bacterium]|uniref:Phosphoribosylformylglycinamidine cyclo-ligase n=1 Tax=Candidatus Thalassospirochaeta sargassi TaxID=3119039 RepID=A0AAJ1MKW7_9SPIO|nr:phosphoribosylformylglycinamidine cyclo-ligase [Spirochaetales bacterium]
MDIKSYSEAGVDIEKGDRFASYISSIKSSAVSNAIGGFAGGVELDMTGFKQPIMLSATDGVGTKLIVAQKLKKYDTLGIDLTAMCVNDLAVCGAWPLSFLDYIGCGSLNEGIMKDVIKGIVDGCEQAECILAGGETAEMPDMYPGDDFDLAGFCVGIVEKSKMLPFTDKIKSGDIILGLPSSGIHSNGLSLARKVIPDTDKTLMNMLLKPTVIYVKALKSLMSTGKILSAAHITGGGLEGNLKRVIPAGVESEFKYDWHVPEIFDVISQKGGIEDSEMRRVFNMGVGIAMIVHPEDAQTVLDKAASTGIEIFEAGRLK